MGYGVLDRRGDYGVLRRSRGDAFLPALIGGIGLVKKGVSALRSLKKGKTAVKALKGAGSVAGGLATGLTIKSAVQGTGPFERASGGRRRRMNVANPKALKRAIRREQGFIKLARRTLKGTGFVISRRGMASKRKPFGRK